MTDRPKIPTQKKRDWLRYFAIGIAAIVFVFGASVLVAKRMSDGPLTEMIPGGAAARSGPLEAERRIWPRRWHVRATSFARR